jgi:hypothetical protein
MIGAKRLGLVSALLVCTGGLSACAGAKTAATPPTQTASQAPDVCFGNSDITNVNIVDERTLYVSTRRGYVYRLDSPGACYVQGASISVGALSGGPGRGTCVGNQARVAVGGPLRGPSVQCIAQITGPYTDSRSTGLWSRTATN